MVLELRLLLVSLRGLAIDFGLVFALWLHFGSLTLDRRHSPISHPTPVSDTSDHEHGHEEEPQDAAAEVVTDQPEEEPPRYKKAKKAPGPRKLIKLSDHQEDEVKEFLLSVPGLYDRSTKMWADPIKKELEWQNLADQIQISRQELATWYKTMRKDLGQLGKKSRTSGTDGWSYLCRQRWERWSFLEPFIQEVAPRSTPCPPAPQTDNDTMESVTAVDDQRQDAPSPQHQVLDIATDTAPLSRFTGRPRNKAGSQAAASRGVPNQLGTHPMTAIIENSRESTRDILQFLRAEATEHQDTFIQQRIYFGRYVSSTLKMLPASQGISNLISAALNDSDTRKQHPPQIHQQQQLRTESPLPGCSALQQKAQGVWQPPPTQWISNRPLATSVWATQGCDYMQDYRHAQQSTFNNQQPQQFVYPQSEKLFYCPISIHPYFKCFFNQVRGLLSGIHP